jgi:ribosome-associated translation inhibitor RaiA
MEIIVNTVDFRTDGELEAFVRNKVGKLFNQYSRIVRAYVWLREGDKNSRENKLCEIRLVIPGNDHFVKKCTEAYEKSVFQAVEVLRKIIRRKKRKPHLLHGAD